MKRRRVVLSLIAAISLVLASNAVLAAEAQWKWKTQLLWSPQETPYKMFEQFVKDIKEVTGGRLEIQPFPGGAVVPNTDALDAVKNNVLQAMWQGPVYFSGKNPAMAALGELTMAWEHPMDLDMFMYKGGGLEMLRDFYKPFGVHAVVSIIYGMESYPSKKPLRRLEDFKGLKIRVPQGMEAELLTKLGASVIVLPGTEVYSALDKGVIDATNWSTPSMNDKLGYHKIAPYFTYPGWHSMPINDFSVNEREWSKLPADVKAILETGLRRFTLDLMETVIMEDLQTVQEARARGATPIAWTSEEKFRIRKEARAVWAEWKKKSPQTQKAIELQETFLRKMGRID
jgi:TRAP-type mannitol/chloroaromatic compound transport system substrate-binding protein